jgi:hypothetical protein
MRGLDDSIYHPDRGRVRYEYGIGSGLVGILQRLHSAAMLQIFRGLS